jgi:hypothetical protein
VRATYNIDIMTTRKPGNRNWGKPGAYVSSPAGLTEFEKQVQQLRLNEPEYASSEQLRLWCERNKDRCYIPEGLLLFWRISVNPLISE